MLLFVYLAKIPMLLLVFKIDLHMYGEHKFWLRTGIKYNIIKKIKKINQLFINMLHIAISIKYIMYKLAIYYWHATFSKHCNFESKNKFANITFVFMIHSV